MWPDWFGTATAGLVQTYTVAPATYPESPGAPYGAGHCNFTAQSRIAHGANRIRLTMEAARIAKTHTVAGGRQFAFYPPLSFSVKEETQAVYAMAKIGNDSDWR